MRHSHTAFAAPDSASLPLHCVGSDQLPDWLESQPARVRNWLDAVGFKAASGTAVCVPNASGGLSMAVCGLGAARAKARGRMALGAVRLLLPVGVYHLASGINPEDLSEQCLGWLLAGYRFDRFRRPGEAGDMAALKAPEGIDVRRIEIMAAAECLTRDLINTPASQMGPEELETTLLALSEEFEAQVSVTYSDDLLQENFPLIHAVGRASARIPRLLDMRWGQEGPRVTLVGKGVCFDTGGLNIKPGASMGLMKKDMGGAATVLGLAMMIMALDWKVRLRVIIPAVENSISGEAMRPGDVLTARNGLTIEVNNTDAEGRLVLADALSLADEESPDALICMATLTGAARAALGPDLPPFYTDSDSLAEALTRSARTESDPLWRMPFYEPYETMIEPAIADLDNAPSGGMAGSITAALFLRRFVAQSPNFAHFDIYGWQPTAAPGRPKGGVGQGARAILGALPRILGDEILGTEPSE